MTALDERRAVVLGGLPQWIRVRGDDGRNPPLLLVQQGPGFPMLQEAGRLERALRLEDRFTVVYWDQRGCGRTLRSTGPPVPLTLAQLTADLLDLAAYLAGRFGRPPVVVGFSQGGTLALRAAAERPELVAAVVAAAPDVDGPAAGALAYDFALSTARARGNRPALRRLTAIGRPPHVTAREFAVRVRWVSAFGGVRRGVGYATLARTLLSDLLRSPDYSPRDVVRTLRGMAGTQDALLPELETVDLVRDAPRIAVPVAVAHGRHDRVASGDASERFVQALDAPRKRLAWFAESAHLLQFEEPGRLRSLILETAG